MFTVSLMEGASLQIGDRRLTVRRILPGARAVCSLDGEDEPVIVIWDRKTLVLPDVSIFVSRKRRGKSEHQPHMINLVIDAPRSVKLGRIGHDQSQAYRSDPDSAETS